MEYLGRKFGFGEKKAKETKPTPAQAIQNLRETEKILFKKQEFLEEKIKHENEIIRKNGTANKRISVQALKRRKRYEKLLEQIDGTLSTLEFQRESLENASTNMSVLKAMGEAAKAHKAALDNMDVDSVEDLMDDVREQQQMADEITNALSNPIMAGQDVDEDQLMKEIEDLEQQEIDRKLLDTDPLPKLPDAPTTEIKDVAKPAAPATNKPASTEKKLSMDDELAELADWAL